MTAAVAPVAALLVSVALLLMGNGLQGTLLPVRASLEEFSALDIGVLGSSYFVGFAAGCLLGPHVVRRAGHIRSFAAMVAIASSVALLHALVVDAYAWWILRMTTGFCFAVLYMVIESWLNERSTNENRGLIFSIYTIINLTVITIGQLMLMLDDPWSFPLFSLASILVSLAAVPIALTTAQAPAPIEAVRIRFAYLYKLSPVGVMGCFAVGLANGAFWSLAPVFAQTEDSSTARVALFMSVAVIAGALGQWPLGRLSDRMDRRKVIVLAAFGAALAGVGMTVFNPFWDWAIFVFIFLFGLFAFPMYSLSVAHMNDFVEPKGFLEAAGGLLLVFGIGAVLGPLLASTTMRFMGVGTLFAYTAAVHVLIVVFVIYRMRRRGPASEEERVAFADSIRVAQTVSTVDPLSHESSQTDLDTTAANAEPTQSGAEKIPKSPDDGEDAAR